MRHYDAAKYDAVPSGNTELTAEELLIALRAAEAELTESRRRFDSLARSFLGLFYRCRLEWPWTMSFVSEGVEALTGYRAEEVERMNGWAEIILPNDLAAIQKAVEKAVAARRPFTITYRIVHKSGEVRWVSEKGHVIEDETGQPAMLEGVISDISGRKEAEELQRTLMGRWRKTLDTIPQMVWSMSGDGSDEFFNRQWTDFTGQMVGKAYGVARSELVHPDDKKRALAAWDRSFATGQIYEAQYRLRHVSGDHRWVLSRACAEKDPHGQIIRWYGTCTDIHDRVVAQERLSAQQEFVHRLIDASPDSLILLDANGSILFANDNACRGLGLAKVGGKVAGHPWTEILPPKVREDAKRAVSTAYKTQARTRFTAELPGAEAAWWDVIVTPLFDGGHARLLVTSRNITHQKLAENRARWSASHDTLTQLPNRTVLQKRLDLLAGQGAAKAPFALLLLDVDDFKRTNDTLGHDAGDALLCAFAHRLQSAAGTDNLVARLGGDEFAVIATSIEDVEQLQDFAQKLFDALRPPCVHGGKLLECRASIGGSLYPEHGRSPGDLLKHSDLALYVAKGSGRGTLKIFESSMRAEAQRRESMISLAKLAIGENLIVPYYQPKVEMASGRIAGFEALLRWRHPRHGLQAPDSIKAAFEDLSLAAEISDRMIDCVMADLRAWLDRGLDPGHVAINAAAAEFRRGDFAERLLERMERASIPTRCIQVEVTETVFLGRGGDYVERALTTLNAHGVSVALDDFGTGFASLSHLKQFPVHIIKIDRSFVGGLLIDGGDNAIVDAVVSLGRSLSIDVVAEGIETPAQHDTLLALGCRYGQGFLYGKAESAADAEQLLNRPLHAGAAFERPAATWSPRR